MTLPVHTIAVIDFETTGMSPSQGARATEIAAVLLRDGEVVGRYQSLMRSGAWVPPFIEQLTGISNRMLASAPPAEQVMREVSAFTRGCALVAHNASFDRGFWHAERRLAGIGAGFDCTGLGEASERDSASTDVPHDASSDPSSDASMGAASQAPAPAPTGSAFACTLLLARRLYPSAPNHRLGTLAALHGIRATGRAHRAMADADMAAQLWLQIAADVQRRWSPPGGTTFELLARLQACPRAKLERWMGALAVAC